MTTTTVFIARTAYGAPIVDARFRTREEADFWLTLNGDNFPGWRLTIETTVVRQIFGEIERDPEWKDAA
jgi:hypothetical protein